MVFQTSMEFKSANARSRALAPVRRSAAPFGVTSPDPISRIELRPTRAANPSDSRVLGVAVLFWTGIRLALELSGFALIFYYLVCSWSGPLGP